MNLSLAFTQIGQWFAAHALRLLPGGGAAGQVLRKIDGADYNTEWATPAAGSGPTVTAPAYGAMTAGAIVRLVLENGAPAPTIRGTAPDPGGLTLLVGALVANVAAPGDPATMALGVVVEDPTAFLTLGDTAYLGAANNLSASPSQLPVGVVASQTTALLTYDFPRAGSVKILARNTDGSVTYLDEQQIAISWLSDSTTALVRTGPGAYGLGRPSELILSSGPGYGIPIQSEVNVILYDSADSTLFDASQGLAANKSVVIVQIGAGQVKLDGFAIKCNGLPITNTVNSVITVHPTQYGATVVSGDLAAADTASYYTGLDESAASLLAFYGALQDTGGMTAQGSAIVSNRTRDPVPAVRAYAEFSVLVSSGSLGFAKTGYSAGNVELGLDGNSMALRVSADFADLEIWHNGAAVATIAGAGSLAFSVTRFGVLVDRVTGEFWLRTAAGWLGQDPATDPGFPFFPGGLGGGTPWLALEARPGGGDQRLFFMPSSLTWATEASAAGSLQNGWLHP